MSLKTSAVNRYGLRRSFMNIRKCPWQVILSFYPVKIQVLRLFFTERTIKIQSGDLKSRIDACQKDCASLKDKFYNRLHLDTNTQVKVGLQQTGTFLLTYLLNFFSNLFAVGIGRTLNAMIDDKLGASELHSSIIGNNLFKFTQRIRFASGWPHLTAPGI
jgi:hypothetical protein